MSKVKTKKIKIPLAKDEDLAEMFNQMLGTGTVNLTIAYPRYKRIKKLIEQLIKIFEMLAAAPFFRQNPVFHVEQEEIASFCRAQRLSIQKLFFMDLSDYEWNYDLVDEELQKRFTEAYEAMKKSDMINHFILLCDRLVRYKRNFADVNNLSHKFINTMPGTEWCPFPFTRLNIKGIFAMPEMEGTIVYFMTVVAKSFELSFALYKEIQSPDIDVDKFVEVIMKNIDEIQKRPELHRCRKAFDKIKQSVHLLKDNFTSYYRDFVGTKDSTIMMQHFILDVSKNTDADAQVTNQFRQIIAYYRKIAAENVTNPKAKMLLDKINSSLSQLERGTENLVKVDEAEEDTTESGDEIPFGPSAISISMLSMPVEDVLNLAKEVAEEEGYDVETDGNLTFITKSKHSHPPTDHSTHSIIYHCVYCVECDTLIRRCKDGYICQKNHKVIVGNPRYAKIDQEMNKITARRMRFKAEGIVSPQKQHCPECGEEEVSRCSCDELRYCKIGHKWRAFRDCGCY